jgi:hypothetical protein
MQSKSNPWRVRPIDVRERDGSLRWQLEGRSDDETAIVFADSTREGHVFDLQADRFVGTSGSAELDDEIRECIADTLAARRVLQSLDAIDRPRGRSDRLRFAA